jgi:hypothetical protein
MPPYGKLDDEPGALLDAYERLRARSERQTNGCVLVQSRFGVEPKRGYLGIKVGDTTRQARRVAYTVQIGEIPANHCVDSTCGRLSCIAESHLRVVPRVEVIRRSDCPAGLNFRKTECAHGRKLWVGRDPRFRTCRCRGVVAPPQPPAAYRSCLTSLREFRERTGAADDWTAYTLHRVAKAIKVSPSGCWLVRPRAVPIPLRARATFLDCEVATAGWLLAFVCGVVDRRVAVGSRCGEVACCRPDHARVSEPLPDETGIRELLPLVRIDWSTGCWKFVGNCYNVTRQPKRKRILPVGGRSRTVIGRVILGGEAHFKHIYASCRSVSCCSPSHVTLRRPTQERETR